MMPQVPYEDKQNSTSAKNGVTITKVHEVDKVSLSQIRAISQTIHKFVEHWSPNWENRSDSNRR